MKRSRCSPRLKLWKQSLLFPVSFWINSTWEETYLSPWIWSFSVGKCVQSAWRSTLKMSISTGKTEKLLLNYTLSCSCSFKLTLLRSVVISTKKTIISIFLSSCKNIKNYMAFWLFCFIKMIMGWGESWQVSLLYSQLQHTLTVVQHRLVDNTGVWGEVRVVLIHLGQSSFLSYYHRGHYMLKSPKHRPYLRQLRVIFFLFHNIVSQHDHILQLPQTQSRSGILALMHLSWGG